MSTLLSYDLLFGLFTYMGLWASFMPFTTICYVLFQMLIVLQLGISAMKTTCLFPDLDPATWHVQQYSPILESATLVRSYHEP